MTLTKKINCLVVDDEPPALQIIEKYISAVTILHLSAACNNAVEALAILKKRQIDLIFLDIQMPFILGTDFIRTLSKPPKVIFTTAHRKFAVEGFDLAAIDYLLKPISFERFLKAVNKVLDLSLNHMISEEIISKKAGTEVNFVQFRVDRKIMKVLLEDILYVESLKDYIKVFTKGKTIITKQPISALEKMLPDNLFARIHRSYIVSLDKIQSYTTEYIEINNKQLPVSRMYRHELSRIFKPK
jgi:DNA-binding LytR/AlgR family response regulator